MMDGRISLEPQLATRGWRWLGRALGFWDFCGGPIHYCGSPSTRTMAISSIRLSDAIPAIPMSSHLCLFRRRTMYPCIMVDAMTSLCRVKCKLWTNTWAEFAEAWRRMDAWAQGGWTRWWRELQARFLLYQFVVLEERTLAVQAFILFPPPYMTFFWFFGDLRLDNMLQKRRSFPITLHSVCIVSWTWKWCGRYLVTQVYGKLRLEFQPAWTLPPWLRDLYYRQWSPSMP